MRFNLRAILIASAVLAAAPSCASRVETHRTFPPVADLAVVPEPAYPEAALQPGDAGEAAERAWWNEMLLWGRGHRDKVARICRWARDLGLEVPAGYCG